MQDNGQLTSTRQDTPMIPAPEDDDVDDWIKKFLGEVEQDDRATWDDISAFNMERHTVVSGSYDTIRNIVRKFDPPLKEEHIELYREWLVENSPVSSYWTYDMIQMRRTQCVEQGLHFIPPTGANWETMLLDNAHKLKTCGTSSREVNKLMNSAMAWAVRWMQGLKLNTKYAHGAKLSTRKTYPQADALITSLTQVPKNLKDAFQTGDSIGWKEAAELEMSTLTEMGVFDHGCTMDELIKAGCTNDPIHISVVLTNKFKDGIFDRHKVHMTVAGHKYNMTKGTVMRTLCLSRCLHHLPTRILHGPYVPCRWQWDCNAWRGI